MLSINKNDDSNLEIEIRNRSNDPSKVGNEDVDRTPKIDTRSTNDDLDLEVKNGNVGHISKVKNEDIDQPSKVDVRSTNDDKTDVDQSLKDFIEAHNPKIDFSLCSLTLNRNMKSF